MGAIGAAVAGGVASAAIGTAGSALMGGKSSQGAGQAQQSLQQQRADLAPWRTTGGLANTASTDLLGLNGQDAANAAMGNFQKSPGYQWQLDQGLQAVDHAAAAKGFTRSGGTLEAEQKYGQGLANQDFTSYYNRLLHLSDTGESAAAGGATTANAAAGLAQNAGDTQASIYGQAAKGLGSTVSGLFSNPAVQNQLFGGGSTFTPSADGTYGGQSVYTGPTNTGAPINYNF